MKLLRQLGVGMIALTAAFLAVPEQGHAMNGQNQIGYGVKSKGMGGVGIALPQDSLAAASNPAGMTYVADRWDIGVGYVFQDIKNNVTPAGSTLQNYSSDRGVWLPEAGVAYMFCPCQVVGVSIFVNGGIATNFNSAVVGWGTTPLSLQYYQLAVAPSWSWRINRANSIGVAVNLYATSFNLKGSQNGAAISVFPDDLTNRGTDYEAGLSVRLGWLGNICDCVMIGFTFQTKSWIGKIKDYQGFLPDAGNADLPGNIGVGITWRPFSCFTISGEWVQVLWTGPKWFGNSYWATDGTLGGTNGIGLDWNQQTVLKIGAAYRLLPCFTIRAGYNWAKTPIRVTDTFINFPVSATVEHHVTAGATYACDCNEFSFYYYYGFRNKINGQSPAGLTSGAYNLSNRQQAVGVSYGRIF